MYIKNKKIHNEQIRSRIMDLRDSRIRIQRKVAELEDKQLFEPENFNADDQYWLRYHKSDVARIKAEEARLRTLVR